MMILKEKRCTSNTKEERTICLEKQENNNNQISTIKRNFQTANKDKIMRNAWNVQINQDYDLYLAILRANQDSKYLMEERHKLMQNLKKEHMLNIHLRKEIRALEKEINTMCHKNAHKMFVIDGLQEKDEKTKSTKFLNSNNNNHLEMEERNINICGDIIGLLRSDVSQLESKTKSDCNLIANLLPHKFKLQDILDTIKLEIHQEAVKYMQELDGNLERVGEFHTDLDCLLSRFLENRIWIEKSFEAFMHKAEAEIKEVSDSETSDQSDESESQSEEKKSKKSKKSKSSKSKGGKSKKAKSKKSSEDESDSDEDIEFTTEIDILKKENYVLTNLILSQFQRIDYLINDLADSISWLCELRHDQYLINDYIERLLIVKGKRESREAQSFDQQGLDEIKAFLNVHVEEGSIISKFLKEYADHIFEDFFLSNVFLNSTKELFFKELQS